jgi:glutamate N-acetyltransferase/amino-acid N-acetyltransferase
VEIVESRIDLRIGNICVVKAGCPLSFDNQGLIGALRGSEVVINLKLNLGLATATAWGCDLSEEYVTINSQYMT